MGFLVYETSKSKRTRENIRRLIHNLNLPGLLELLYSEDGDDTEEEAHEDVHNILVSLASWFPSINATDLQPLESVNIPNDVSKATPSDQVMNTLYEKERDTRRDICYTVIDYTRDKFTGSYDLWLKEMGNALIQASKHGDDILVDTLMHSGADLFYKITTDTEKDEPMTVWDIIMMNNSLSNEVVVALDTLFPGLPQTVASCTSLDTVRRLLRMWVYPPPLDRCSELVKSEIAHHSKTIQMIHAIHANNERKVESILTTHASTVDVNARAIDRVHGPTILWYVIEKKQSQMAHLLVSHGARVDYTVNIEMSQDNIITLPVLYAGLSDASVTVEMMEALLQQSSSAFSSSAQMRFKETLYRMLFNGKNILEQALESSMNLQSFRVLLNAVGAKAIADRNSQGKTIRDIAASSAATQEYVQLIDECVMSMIQDTEKVDRKILALFGYDITNLNMQEPPVDDFYSLYGEYQKWIRDVCRSIDKNDITSFTDLLEYSGEGNFERLIAWEGREGSANPLPMLHRAVIFNRKEMVQAILKLRPPGYSIDSLLDHQRRTALHYAYAKSEFAEIRDILRAHGCSERVKDRNGYEPLDFKYNQDRNCTVRLIGQMRFGEFSSAEPRFMRRKFKATDSTYSKYIHINSQCDNEDPADDDTDGDLSSEDASDDDTNWINDEDDDDGAFENQLDACSIM